jgi:hypothetical protein
VGGPLGDTKGTRKTGHARTPTASSTRPRRLPVLRWTNAPLRRKPRLSPVNDVTRDQVRSGRVRLRGVKRLSTAHARKTFRVCHRATPKRGDGFTECLHCARIESSALHGKLGKAPRKPDLQHPRHDPLLIRLNCVQGHCVPGLMEGRDLLGAHARELLAIAGRRRSARDGHSGKALSDHLRDGNSEQRNLQRKRH